MTKIKNRKKWLITKENILFKFKEKNQQILFIH
jgi:hypothetical protein